eukprot:jgi/Picre1/33786/NNA_001265.t1
MKFLDTKCAFSMPLFHQPRGRMSGRVQASTTQLPERLDTIVASFKAVPDPMQRYKQLLFYASKIEPLEGAYKVEENKVKGCVSQVWVVPQVQEDGTVQWMADSDSQLTKGLAALLVQGLSGITPKEIITIQPEFITELGLQQSLTPSRNNGFLNMFKLMQSKALELAMESVNAASSGAGARDATVNDTPVESNQEEHHSEEQETSSTPVGDSIRRKLEQELEPTYTVILDESSRHANHAERMGAASRRDTLHH